MESYFARDRRWSQCVFAGIMMHEFSPKGTTAQRSRRRTWERRRREDDGMDWASVQSGGKRCSGAVLCQG